jgi:hypothetical protein
MLKVMSICAALSLVLISYAMAQTRTGVCEADFKKACANVTPGGGRIAACIKEHLAELSDPCKARLAEAVAAAKTCRADVEKQCSGMKRRVQKVACIKDAVTKLGDECKAAAAAVVTAKK